MMSMNLQSWQLAHNHANYYLSRNMGDDHNSTSPYLWEAINNNINGEYIDGVFVTDAAALFRTNRNLSQLHNHRPNHYGNSSHGSRNTIGNHLAFIAHENPPLFVTDGEYIDGVFVTDAASLFRTNRHLSQPHNHQPNTFGNHLAPHNNNYVLWDPYSYHQFIDHAYVTTEDVNQLIVAMQILDRNFGSRLSGQPFDYRALLDLPGHDTEVSHQEEEEEYIIMMKTRTHCANKVEVDSEEICSICLCEYVNDDTIGTLECGHEYHATCIEQWLLKGKKNCPICRSSVLPES